MYLKISVDEQYDVLRSIVVPYLRASYLSKMFTFTRRSCLLEIKNLCDHHDLYYMVGLVLSDGYLRRGKKYIYFETLDLDLTKAIATSFPRVKVKVKYKYIHMDKYLFTFHAYPCKYHQRLLEPIIDEEKLLNEIRSSMDNLASFVAGLIDGDGSANNDSITIYLDRNDRAVNILRRLNLISTYSPRYY